MAIGLESDKSNAENRQAGIEWGVIPESRLGELRDTGDRPFSPAQISTAIARQDRGDVCWGGTHRKRVVVYGWMSNNYAELPVLGTVKIGSEWVYLYKDYVNREYRGKNLQLESIRGRMRLAKESDAQRALSYVAGGNIPSIKNYQRAGFAAIGAAVVVNLGKIHMSFPSLRGVNATITDTGLAGTKD